MGIAGALIGSAVIGGVTTAVAGSKSAGAIKDAANTAAAQADRASEVNKYIFDTTRADYAPARAVGQSALYKLADMYGVSRPTTTATQTTGTMFSQPPASGVLAQFGIDSNAIEPYSGQTYGDLYGAYTAQPAADNATSMTPGFEGFQMSPGYQFRLNEGLKAIERSAAARGALRSGATMKSINRFAEGNASAEYENYANRLAALAGVGQNANSGSAQAGQAYASGAANLAAQQGNAALAAGNARASAYQNTGNAINGTIQNVASAYLYNKGYGGFGGGGGYGGPYGGI